MNRWKRWQRIWVVLALPMVLWSPSVAQGEAFRLMDKGTAAAGQGSAFAAQADDPSALHYNPAGMTQLEGIQVYTGAQAVGGEYDFTSPSGARFKANLVNSIAIPPPQVLYLTGNLKKLDLPILRDLTLGIGLNSPYGLIINYPQGVPFSASVTQASLPLLDIKPTVAYRVNDYLSIGGGFDIYTFASFAGKGGAYSQAFIPPTTKVELRGKDSALGWNVGALLTPWSTDGKPRLNLAFVYRSQTTLNLGGNFLVNGGNVADAAFDIHLPQIFTGGVALWPVRDDRHEWKLEVDVDYADWGSFHNLDVHLTNGVTLLNPRNWSGAVIVHVGTEYKWLRPSLLPDWDVAARAGYIRSETPVPNNTFEPNVPDGNFNSFSVGLGLLCKGAGRFLGLVQCANEWGIKGIGLDVAYYNQLYESRTITNNINPVVNGTWQTSLHAGSISLRINF